MRESATRQMSQPPPEIAALPLEHQRALRDALRAALEQPATAAAGAAAPAGRD